MGQDNGLPYLPQGDPDPCFVCERGSYAPPPDKGVLPLHPANGWQQKGVEEQFTTVIPQEMYLFCCFSAYLQVFLAIYNYLALHVIEVCIRPTMSSPSLGRFRAGCTPFIFKLGGLDP